MHRAERATSAIAETLDAIRAPWWLKSPYGAPVLIADFSPERPVTLNFEVTLPNGSHLTGQENRRLLSEIYDFLCLQSHPLARKQGRNRGEFADRRHLLEAVHVVDYFLLNAGSMALCEHGFAAVGTQHVTQYLLDIGSSPSTEEGIYAWSKNLTLHLKQQAATVTSQELEETVKALPELSVIDVPKTQWRLKLTSRELLLARVYLHRNGLYRPLARKSGRYLLGPNTRSLSQLVHGGTILGRSGLASWSHHPELCVAPQESAVQELRRVVVWAGRADGRCSRKRLERYREKLLTWRTLSRLGIGISLEVLDAARDASVSAVASLKDIDGVTMVPPEVVARALKDAVSFFYEHGDHLLVSLARVLREAAACGLKPAQLAAAGSFEPVLRPETRSLGVLSWSTVDYLRTELRRRPTGSEVAACLRHRRIGLFEMVRILYGACQVIVGTVQAARQGEIMDLTLGSIDPTEQWLGLLSRKSGFGSLRRLDYRPAPQVAVHVLKRLAGFLSDAGSADKRLFAIATYSGDLSMSRTIQNEALDLFCDYFETAADVGGARYYLREHQLRKFFAATFFQCCGFAGLDTLRWVLRHYDLEQVWAYLKASMPGGVLRHYKSTAVAQNIRHGASDLAELTLVLQKRFGVSSFTMISDGELVELLDELQDCGVVDVEPAFGVINGEPFIRLGVVVWEEA